MSINLEDIKSISKRNFLEKIGMVAGSTALYTAMSALDLVHASAQDKPPLLSTEGKGKTVLILGAGLSGLVTALELSKKGYKCQIIEAREHSGGRSQTARKGTVIEELAGERQVCDFDHNQYLNLGPWRIPAEHKAVIYYCRELGVELEPLINKSVHAYYYSENIDGQLKGRRVRQVELDVDRAGSIQELLAKAVNSGSLDDDLDTEDKERLLDYLATTGLLDRKKLNYRANRARGHEIDQYPGTLLDAGKLSEPFKLAEFLKINIGERWNTADHPAVMYQAKGGMDKIPFAMEKVLKPGSVSYNSEVTYIQNNDENVVITVKNTKSGIINYTSGDDGFKINEEKELPAPQQKALDLVKTIFSKIPSTGIQKILNTAVFDSLNLIAVYPVEDESKLTNKDGVILPDAKLIPQDSTAKDLASLIHADIAKGFLHAIDCKTKQRIGGDQKLKHGDVIKIVSTLSRG